MYTLRLPLTVLLAFSAVCLTSSLHAGVVAPGRSGGSSFTPTVVQGWTDSIGGLFASPTPDLSTLNPMLSALKGSDLGDPNLAPLRAAVRSQVETLRADVAAQPSNTATASKLVALDILGDFHPETRSQMAELSRAYNAALPGTDQEKIQALRRQMTSMAQALGRTPEDGAKTGILENNTGPSNSAPKRMPSEGTLQPAKTPEELARPARTDSISLYRRQRLIDITTEPDRSLVSRVRAWLMNLLGEKDMRHLEDIPELSGSLSQLLKIARARRSPTPAANEKQVSKGLLLRGSASVRSAVVQALAVEAKAYLIYISAANMPWHMKGAATHQIEGAFQAARHNTPAVLFIDEIEDLSSPHSGMDDHERITANDTLINQIDRLDGSGRVIVVLGTSRSEQYLDARFLRAGRVDKIIKLRP